MYKRGIVYSKREAFCITNDEFCSFGGNQADKARFLKMMGDTQGATVAESEAAAQTAAAQQAELERLDRLHEQGVAAAAAAAAGAGSSVSWLLVRGKGKLGR